MGGEDPLKEGIATRSSILVWRIPWIEEPGRLQSIRSQRVGHDCSDLALSNSMPKSRGEGEGKMDAGRRGSVFCFWDRASWAFMGSDLGGVLCRQHSASVPLQQLPVEPEIPT